MLVGDLTFPGRERQPGKSEDNVIGRIDEQFSLRRQDHRLGRFHPRLPLLTHLQLGRKFLMLFRQLAHFVLFGGHLLRHRTALGHQSTHSAVDRLQHRHRIIERSITAQHPQQCHQPPAHLRFILTPQLHLPLGRGQRIAQPPGIGRQRRLPLLDPGDQRVRSRLRPPIERHVAFPQHFPHAVHLDFIQQHQFFPRLVVAIQRPHRLGDIRGVPRFILRNRRLFCRLFPPVSIGRQNREPSGPRRPRLVQGRQRVFGCFIRYRPRNQRVCPGQDLHLNRFELRFVEQRRGLRRLLERPFHVSGFHLRGRRRELRFGGGI